MGTISPGGRAQLSRLNGLLSGVANPGSGQAALTRGQKTNYGVRGHNISNGVTMYQPTGVAKRRTSPYQRQLLVGNQREMTEHEGRSMFPSPEPYLGETQAGRDWAMAALDPCAPEAPMSVGLPDTMTAAVVTPGYRAEHSISWDVTMFAKADDAAGMESWGVQIVSVPIGEIGHIYRLRNETKNVWSNWRVLRMPGFELKPSETAESSRATLFSAGYAKYRIIAHGTTIELDAPEIANQGRIISGQLEIAAGYDPTTIYEPTAIGSGEKPTEMVGGVVARRYMYVVPDSPGYVVQVCPRAYQAEAKRGAYIIHKFDGPLTGYDFVDTGEDYFLRWKASTGVSPVACPATFLCIASSDTPDPTRRVDYDKFTKDSSAVPWCAAGTVMGATALEHDASHPCVSCPSRMLASVTFFEGLSGVAGAASVTPTIRLKTRKFLECLATTGAGVAPFTHPAPIWDIRAVTRVVQIMQQYDDAYPAECNDFGDILGTIWRGLENLGESVSGIWNNVVKPVGKVVESGLALAGLF